MSANLQLFLQIMLFYIVISYLIGPLIFYYFVEKTLNGAGNGFIAGSILSIILWIAFGSKMIRK
jgi:hypothetical protein